jgi:hypothetical protein
LENVEVEKKSSENSKKTIKGEISPYRPSSDQIQESLRIINEETLQLSEFLLQEEKLIKELCVLLKQVLRRLSASFNLPSNIFPQTWKTQRIILNDEAHLIFINSENKVKSKALEDFPPQVILNVVSFIIPELSKSLTSYRKRISLRIGLFDRINQELRNIRSIFASHPKKLEENMNPLNNGVKKAILAKQRSPGEENKRDKESA